jgi:hypothetical protein
MTDPTNLSDDELFKVWRAASSTDDAVRALWDSAVAAERAHAAEQAASRPNLAPTKPTTEEELVEALRVVVEKNQPGLQVQDALILVVRQTGTPLSDVRYALSLARSQNVVHVDSHTKEITVPEAEPEQNVSAFKSEMYWPPLNMKNYSGEDLMKTLEDSSLSGLMYSTEAEGAGASIHTWADLYEIVPRPAKNLRPSDLKEWATRMRSDTLGDGLDADIIDSLVTEVSYRRTDPKIGEDLISELEWCAFFQDGTRNGELVDLAHFTRYRTAKALRDAAEELARQNQELVKPELAAGQVYVHADTNTKILLHEEREEPMKRIVFESVFRAGKAEEGGTYGNGMLVTASDLQSAGYTLLSEGSAGHD